MKTVCVLIFLSGLVLCAIYDLFFKEISKSHELFLLFAGFPLFILSNPTILRLVSALVIYIICLIFWPKISGKIGGGDVKILLILTVVTGILNTVKSLFYSMVLLLVYVGIYMLFMKIIKNTSIAQLKTKTFPYIPFLLAGFVFCYIS